MDKSVKEYARSQVKAKDNYRKFKETGKSRYQKKADYNFAARDALAMQMKNPATNVQVNNINDSFKISKTKTLNNGVNTNVARASVTSNKSKTIKK